MGEQTGQRGSTRAFETAEGGPTPLEESEQLAVSLSLEALFKRHSMSLCRSAIQWLLIGSFWAMTACALGDQSSGRLAAYFQSPEGSAEWKKSEAELAHAADAAAQAYHRAQTVETLQAYETALRAYLDHGFLLYRVLYASDAPFPKGFRRSLEDRTLELMNIADDYLKMGVSDVVAVEIARAVIHKYTVDRMDLAQSRAEGIMMKYRYQRNY